MGVTDTPTANFDRAWMMGLRATGYKLGARSDEARNLGSWERRGEELKKLGTTQEHVKDRDEDQGDKIGQSKNTRLMCQ